MKQTETAGNINGGKVDSTQKHRVKRIARGVFGVLIIMFSASFYFQLLPLLFVFMGGVMSIPADADMTTMDGGIWMLSCLGVLLPLVWLLGVWVRFIWRRMIYVKK